MLVLSRRPGERLVINEDLIITLVSVKGARVRIGIEGDFKKYKILREELLLNKKK